MRKICLLTFLFASHLSYCQIESLIDREIHENIIALVPSNWETISGDEFGVDFAMILRDSSSIFSDNLNLVATQKSDTLTLKEFSRLISRIFSESYGIPDNIKISEEEDSDFYTLKSDVEANADGTVIPITIIVHIFETQNEFIQFTYMGHKKSYESQKFLIDQMLSSVID